MQRWGEQQLSSHPPRSLSLKCVAGDVSQCSYFWVKDLVSKSMLAPNLHLEIFARDHHARGRRLPCWQRRSTWAFGVHTRRTVLHISFFYIWEWMRDLMLHAGGRIMLHKSQGKTTPSPAFSCNCVASSRAHVLKNFFGVQTTRLNWGKCIIYTPHESWVFLFYNRLLSRAAHADWRC